MRKGCEIFIVREGWTRKQFATQFQRYYNTVGKIDTTALKYLDNEVLIDHIKWLKEFNSNFLKGLPDA